MSDKKSEWNSGDSRARQILGGGSIIVVFGFLVVGLLMGWRYIPGWFGEGFGMLAGLLSTPFLMEGSFVILGFLIVVGLNIWRRHKEGDDYVTMDIPDVVADSKSSEHS